MIFFCSSVPTPPGPIAVESQTEKSINFTWPFPYNMTHANSNFSVSSVNGTSLTANNWFLLGYLESGSPYNISVVTVGVLGYQSSPVTALNYTSECDYCVCKTVTIICNKKRKNIYNLQTFSFSSCFICFTFSGPSAVINLEQTEITTNAVTLVWEQPESKPHYKYEVQVTNGSYFDYEVVETITDTVNGLSSGSKYTFTVTTQTADGTQASPVTVSYFTRMNTSIRLKLLCPWNSC